VTAPPTLLATPSAPTPSPGAGADVISTPSRPTHLVIDAAIWAADRPWLLTVAAVVLIGAVAVRNLLDGWRHRWHSADARLITIAPPPEVDASGAAALWANLSGTLAPSRRRRLLYGSPHVVWQYTWTGRRLLISVWTPGSVPRGAVEAGIRAAWPGAACTTTDPAPPIPLGTPLAVGGHLTPTAAEWLPFTTNHDNDPLRALMSAGSQPKPDEHACVQVLARPANPPPGRPGPSRRRTAARRQDRRPRS
jgi:hypothetical protein